MSVTLLSREDLAAMAITNDKTELVYIADGDSADEATEGTARDICEKLDANAESIFDGGKWNYDTIDEAKDFVWKVASVCTKIDFYAEQATIQAEME